MKPIKIRTIIRHPEFDHFIPNNLKPGTAYYCKCPECGKVIVFTPQINGKGETFGQVFCNKSEECKTKKTSIVYPLKLEKPTKKNTAKKDSLDCNDKEDKKPTDDSKKSPDTIHVDTSNGYRKGIITWGRWPFSHSYTLPVGTTLIGRKTKDSTANVQIRDNYMSENSVTIDVQLIERGYTFDLTVKRAANPVYVGARQCPIGSRVPLDDGDIIKMGNTTLRFKLENKKNK